MPRLHRLLLLPTAAPPPEAASASAESDLAVVLAALLCALICVLGLMAVARCTWLRRGPAAGDPPPAANKGVKKRVLRSIPKVTYSAGAGAGESPECAICLGEFVDGEEVRLLPRCGHAFHVACIDTWLGSHSSCPSCRRVLTAVNGGEGGETAVKVGRCIGSDFLP